MINIKYLNMYKETPLLHFVDMVLLILIYEEQFEFIKEVEHENFIEFNARIRHLEALGYIKKHGSNPEDISMRKMGEELFKKYAPKNTKKIQSEVHLWIDAWRQLFPSGSNIGGYLYRGNRLECLKKMVKFVDSHKYTKEEIFQATKNYVDKFAIKGYSYMQQAHYFIEKRDTGSTLESECEALKDNNNTAKTTTYGRKII